MALRSELGTAPAIRCFNDPSSSMKQSAVEPVPTPMTSPSLTKRIAARATDRFSSSCVDMLRPRLPEPNDTGVQNFERSY